MKAIYRFNRPGVEGLARGGWANQFIRECAAGECVNEVAQVERCIYEISIYDTLST